MVLFPIADLAWRLHPVVPRKRWRMSVTIHTTRVTSVNVV
jgi:hypothetical protein